MKTKTPFSRALRVRVNKDSRSQEELARAIGCSYAALQSWMSGARHPRKTAVVAIETALKLKPGTIEKDARLLPQPE